MAEETASKGFVFQEINIVELCFMLRWSIMTSYRSPQFKYIVFNAFTCIIWIISTRDHRYQGMKESYSMDTG